MNIACYKIVYPSFKPGSTSIGVVIAGSTSIGVSYCWEYKYRSVVLVEVQV